MWSQRISKHDPAMRNEIHWLKKLAVLSGSLMLTACGFDPQNYTLTLFVDVAPT